MLKNKKLKLYKRENINLFLKNPLLSKINFLKNINKKYDFRSDSFINTHYFNQLKEKRKLKIIYGISNKKYNIYYKISKNIKGNILNNILNIFESRIDNLIYRSGISCSRYESKQMINHGFIRLNNILIRQPSTLLKVGDYVSLNFKKKNFFRKNYFFFYFKNYFFPNWIFINKNKISFYLKRIPSINELKDYLNLNNSFISSNCSN